MTITIPTYATTMCAANDSVAVVLDPSINYTTISVDKEVMTWSATFPYGIISGVSACINVTGQMPVKNLTHTVNGVTKTVVGGEQTGSNCWIRMTHPVVSQWVFYRAIADADTCFDKCLTGDWWSFDRSSGVGGLDAPNFRRTLFGSAMSD